jgi:hypothetical protein
MNTLSTYTAETCEFAPSDRVQRVNDRRWTGTVVDDPYRPHHCGFVTVEWDDGPHTFDPSLGDRIGSSSWDCLDGAIIGLERAGR